MRGIILREVILICIVVAVLMLIILVPIWKIKKEKSCQIKCQENLHQVGKGLNLYQIDYILRFPDTNGGGFLARLYQTRHKYIENKEYLICPSSKDIIPDDLLLIDLKGEDDQNIISYAGRKNKVQTTYPGLYRYFFYNTLTSLASDDSQGTPNHENGDYINFLLKDGVVDHKRKSKDEKEVTYYLDPLTN